jgi:hypothetical protein
MGTIIELKYKDIFRENKLKFIEFPQQYLIYCKCSANILYHDSKPVY